MSTVKSPFGQSRIGSNITPTVKLKDGENVFRILPAMGDLAAEGRWSFYHAVHFGYKNSAGKLRPFNSTFKKNRKTQMVEVPDAALARIEQLTAMMEQARASGDTVKFDKLKALVGRGPNDKAQFNLDKKHYMNALDAQGNVVILALSHKAKLALEAEIMKLRAKGVDPLSAEDGRYFSLFRTGKGNETQVQVTVARDAKDAVITHVVDEALLNRLMKCTNGKWTYNEARNLSTLFPFPTPEEIERIVKEGATAVDQILDGSNAQAAQQEPQVTEDEPEVSAPVVSAPPPAVAPAAPTPPVAASAPVAPPAAPIAAKSAAPTTADTVAAQSDADFLASLGV